MSENANSVSICDILIGSPKYRNRRIVCLLKGNSSDKTSQEKNITCDYNHNIPVNRVNRIQNLIQEKAKWRR